MLNHLPKRKRQTVMAAALSTGFVITAAAIILVGSPRADDYVPGERAEGVTTDLSRMTPETYDPVTFTEVSREAGIHFEHFSGERSSQLPEDMGSGAAWGDYNNDGWPDLYVANLAGPLTLSADDVRSSPAHSHLYRNDGDGTFTEVSARAGVDYRGWTNGAAWGDYDGDGFRDLVLATYGKLVIFRNEGDGTFTDRSVQTGIGQFEGFWAGATWTDYDRDGLLDLYVTGYVKYERPEHDVASRQYDVENPTSINPSSFEPERNLLFRNIDGTRFEEVGLKTGISNPEGRSLAAAWVDLDEDGWTDVYVANDVSDNVLYRNRGDGTFEDVSHESRVADYRGAMGIAVGDWDGDTDVDMFVTHWIAQENALYNSFVADDRAAGRAGLLRFMDAADEHGLGQIALDFIGWGTSFLDFDNDGRLDLFVVNGSTLQEQAVPARLGEMQSQLFWNAGVDQGFFDVSSVSGQYFNDAHVGRGAAFADYDRDGDSDVFIVNHGGRGALLRNDYAGGSNWIAVQVAGSESNRHGVGARIRVVAEDLVQIRQVGAQPSYASQNQLTEHFGLGDRATVDTLEITWPRGARHLQTDIPAGRTVTVREYVPPS